MQMLLKTSATLLLIASVLTQAVPAPVTLSGVPSMPRPTSVGADMFAPVGQMPPQMQAMLTNPSAPAKPAVTAADKSKYALLNTEKDNLTEADLSSIFQKDLATLGSKTSESIIDGLCSDKLDAALKAAASDPNALAFIFTQATEGSLCKMLNQGQGDVDAAMKGFKDTEGFTPVANNKAPAAPASVVMPASNNNANRVPITPAAPAAPVAVNMPASNNNGIQAAAKITPPTIPATGAPKNPTTNTGNAVVSGNNTDPKVVAEQKAKQEDQMKEAQNAINNLFSQVGTRMNMGQAMPNINFGAPGMTMAPVMGAAPSVDLGAGLARVPATA